MRWLALAASLSWAEAPASLLPVVDDQALRPAWRATAPPTSTRAAPSTWGR